MYQSYAGIVLLVIAAVVSFVLAWSRSDHTPMFVGHAFLAAACVLTFFSGGPSWLLVAAGAVFVVNAGVLIRHVARD